MARTLITTIAAFLIASSSARAIPQQNSASGEPGLYQVRPNLYMIAGAGSNIGVQVGADGVVLVDAGTEFALQERA